MKSELSSTERDDHKKSDKEASKQEGEGEDGGC